MHISISVSKLLATVAPLALTPLFMGVTLREVLPRVSKIAQKVLGLYSKACILILLVLFIVPGLLALIKFSLAEFAAILIIISLALAAGYYLGGPEVKDRISIALAGTQCNLTALIVIAHVSYPKVHILGPLLAYIILSFLVVAAWYRFLLYRMKRRGETIDQV
jgi:BASS family bile acid:Na+ symporter